MGVIGKTDVLEVLPQAHDPVVEGDVGGSSAHLVHLKRGWRFLQVDAPDAEQAASTISPGAH